MASVNLLHKRFPEHTIVVLLYRRNETVKYLDTLDYVEIGQSLHSYMYGVKEKRMDFGEGLADELRRPIVRRLNNQLNPIRQRLDIERFLKNPPAYLGKYEKANAYFKDLCTDADVFVMSGGGYLNNWSEMLLSKCNEVTLAKRYGMKTFMIGQTIGPFNECAKKVYRIILDNVDACFFRDIESVKDTRSLGYDCLDDVIPDLALAEETPCEKENYVAFVPFLTDLNMRMNEIIENLRAIVSDSGCKVVVTVSQQWAWAIQVATSFYVALKSDGIDARLVIPEDHKELERLLSAAQFVFSQNLHGLILAYRGHTPVACLNNRRKFVSFMRAIGHEENLIAPASITKTNLHECYKHRDEFDFENCKAFQSQIRDAIDKIVK